MRSWILLALLPVAWSACDLSGRKPDRDFPNIESEGLGSYQMSVEYTTPDANQTDYYNEYYDTVWRQGRIDSHIRGDSFTYIYNTATWEAWEIKRRQCQLKNLTNIPDNFKSDQSDWLHIPNEDVGSRTIGPSAMLKVALQAWNKRTKDTMAYMGESPNRVRGLKARYWRLCKDNSFVDYVFTTSDDVNAFDFKFLKDIPLRVFFGPDRTGESKGMSRQEYDIISFQPFISPDLSPFQLPKGRGCDRGPLVDLPQIPDLAKSSLQFNAEVMYRVRDWSSGDDVKLWSYASTIEYALDRDSNHMLYYYTPWNSSKSTPEDADPTSLLPKSTIFDMALGYKYEFDYTTGRCQISREKSFDVKFPLPRDLGAIALTDPTILYPNSEFTFVSEGVNRGLAVNIFETKVKDFPLDATDKTITIPDVTITHSYLKDNEVLDNVASEKNALTQVQLRMFGRMSNKQVEEVTFNFFGFRTKLRNRRNLFNIVKCFKNDDDYLWITLTLDTERENLPLLAQLIPSIQAEFMGRLQDNTDLTAVRVPVILVDIKEAVYITMMLLGKPPLDLDYEDGVRGKTVGGATSEEGVSEFNDCAYYCLEEESSCWGFSMCGKTCYFGLNKEANVVDSEECTLWKRYDNKKYMVSKETMARNIQSQVENNQFEITLPLGDDKECKLKASSIQISYPGEDDRTFNQLGHKLDPRMRVHKAGFRLKDNQGSEVRNLGRLSYAECQRLCLDFTDCETVSFCLMDSSCVLSNTFADELDDDQIEEDNTCNLVTRKYADNFERSPGIVLSASAAKVLDLTTVEQCAKACWEEKSFACMSFDHCPTALANDCKLHTVHYPDLRTRENVIQKDSNCGHYFRKFSAEFKKTERRRTVGSKITPLTNVTLEQCSKSCVEYGAGTCFGFDFCQDQLLFATSCTLMDKDISAMKTVDSPICSNFVRSTTQLSPRPYSNSYAGGIGFLCFLIGALVGAGVIFLVAYIRVNRR